MTDTKQLILTVKIMADLNLLLTENSKNVAKRLTDYMDLFDKDADWKRCTDAMRYSLISSGKAIRPFLAVEFAKLFGGDTKMALSFGCGVEMMHASSLIHDDLPAMDNDDMRRGKPSCHKQFDEYTAILAGDALLLTSLEIMTNDAPPELAAEAVHILATYGGPRGMIGGQQLDLEYESKETVTEEMLCRLSMQKTGGIITAACLLGVLASKPYLDAEMYEKAKKAAVDYAYNIGIAFQIYDDLLDVIGDEKILGKPIGSDAEQGKTTFASLLGIEETKKRYMEYTEKAVASIKPFTNSETLIELAYMLVNRNN